ARVRLLQRVEIALLCVTLVVLGLEAMLIFRPAVNRLQASLDQVERRNRLATRRLESLRRLAGGIAHHFNNILTAILGNAVLERMEALRRNRNTEYIDAQIQGCRRAAKIITELVAYSGYGDYKLEPVALAPWLTEIAGFRDPADFPLQLRIEIPGDAVAKIDQVALKQALDGLIANAGEAMLGAGGSTTLRLSQAMLTEPRLMCGPYSAELPAGLYAVFQVIDEGKGMARDDLDHIFDPFYTNKEFGRGLGLASILGIVHGHDGGIAVESTLGRGSTVSLFIPLAGPEPGSAGPSDARAARSGQQQN
ncbi:MAG TPA: ATP-binding protein, partial [Lacunisphaera sp.]|nr:ATP-binding protein [Lacunisphaera sp.]